MLIAHDYKVIIIVNGHGALNHRETISRISKYYSHTSDSMVIGCFPFPDEWLSETQAGHADVYETSLMLFYESSFDVKTHVDLSTLPERNVPLRYPEFSIVDGQGFTKNPSPDKIVTTDPRDADVNLGKKYLKQKLKHLLKSQQKS
jgi:creatinine amidohydrolase